MSPLSKDERIALAHCLTLFMHFFLISIECEYNHILEVIIYFLLILVTYPFVPFCDINCVTLKFCIEDFQ